MQTEVIVENAYTNQLTISTDTDRQTIYNSVGYKTGYRLSGSSGLEAISSSNTNYGISGFISAKPGDTLRVTEFDGASGVACYVIAYDSSNAVTGKIQNPNWSNYATSEEDYAEQILDETIFGSTFNAIRLCLNGLDGDTIVTINEEIGGNSTTKIEYVWTNTGHAFIPADYDDVISDLQSTSTNHEIRITTIEEQYINTTGKETNFTMYISPDGNDENDGLSSTTPKKTVKSCVDSGATKISAKRGIYNEIVSLVDIKEIEIFPTDNDQVYSTTEKRQPIVFEMIDNIDISSFVEYNSIKKVAYSNSNNTQFDKVFIKQTQPPIVSEYGSRYNSTIWLLSEDETSVCVKLKPVLTIAECESEINTFTYVDEYIYINADWNNVEKIIVPINWNNGFYINGSDKVVLREVEVRFSGTYNIDIRNCTFFDFYKCSCKYTSYASGFHPFNSNGVMKACYATKNYDGYGISGYGHTTYIDCVSEFNFDDGMSHHDGTKGTVIGGRYEGNGKGGITPAYGAEVNIYGGIYKDNNSFGIGYLYTSTHNPANGIIQGAVMIGNTVGIRVDTNCEVAMLSCVLKDNTTERDIKGVLTEYGTVTN